MTRRSIINLSAFALIATGAYTLLDARPASAATYNEWCDKMAKVMKMEAEACTADGGSYAGYGTCDANGYSVMPACMYY